MFSESSKPGRGRRVRPLRCLNLHAAVVGLASLIVLGCGHKAPPTPPPPRQPAATKDLTVQQRGNEVVLSFAYPQTTVSGTPLEPLERIEVWEAVRPVPEWTPPTTGEEEISDGSGSGEPGGEAADVETETSIFEPSSGAGDDPSLPDTPPSVTEEPDTLAEGSEQAATSTAGEAEFPDDEPLEEQSGEETATVVQVPTPEELISISGAEFAATASLRVTYEAAAVEASSIGSEILLTLPLETTAPESDDDSSEDSGAGAARNGSIFAIKTGISTRIMSGFSNTVAIAHRTPPEPPARFELEPEQNRVTMRWEFKDDTSSAIVGYNVHRREAQNPRYGLPLAFVPVAEPLDSAEVPTSSEEAESADESEEKELEFVDRSALLGQRYIYALTTVSNRIPLVESAIAVEQELDYTDRFPPRSPTNLIALAEAGRIRLLWDAPVVPDLAGYFVERKDPRGEFVRLNDEPLVETEFSDRDIVSGRTYSYRVVAVDDSGNESGPGNSVEVRAP
jgi:hypothetical protein